MGTVARCWTCCARASSRSASSPSAGLSYSLASQHLQVLLEADAVVRRAAGRQRIYGLEPAPLRLVHDWTAEYERFWQERVARLRRRLGAQ